MPRPGRFFLRGGYPLTLFWSAFIREHGTQLEDGEIKISRKLGVVFWKKPKRTSFGSWSLKLRAKCPRWIAVMQSGSASFYFGLCSPIVAFLFSMIAVECISRNCWVCRL